MNFEYLKSLNKNDLISLIHSELQESKHFYHKTSRQKLIDLYFEKSNSNQSIDLQGLNQNNKNPLLRPLLPKIAQLSDLDVVASHLNPPSRVNVISPVRARRKKAKMNEIVKPVTGPLNHRKKQQNNIAVLENESEPSESDEGVSNVIFQIYKSSKLSRFSLSKCNLLRGR
jgi:hypothetical protein